MPDSPGKSPVHGRGESGPVVLVLPMLGSPLGLSTLLAGLGLLPLPLHRRLLVEGASLHLLEDAVLEHRLLEGFQRQLDLVVDDFDPHWSVLSLEGGLIKGPTTTHPVTASTRISKPRGGRLAQPRPRRSRHGTSRCEVGTGAGSRPRIGTRPGYTARSTGTAAG